MNKENYKKLVLFDIDRTLVVSFHGYAGAFSEGFKKIYGVDADVNSINHHGMTDQQIIIEVLKRKGLTEGEIHSKIGECMDVIAKAFPQFIEQSRFEVMPGVKTLLRELSKRNVLMGLVTGNLEQIARGKMQSLGLEHYFKIGGFGSDDIERVNLVRLAIARAEKGFNFKLDDNIILFGDAPQDIQAAKEAGIKAIGVTTGIYSREDLFKHKPDYILEDLTDIDKILNLLSLV